jgi:methylmalonyl-CoA decarboxylase subunit alpha
MPSTDWVLVQARWRCASCNASVAHEVSVATDEPDAGQLEPRISATPGSADHETSRSQRRTEFRAPTGGPGFDTPHPHAISLARIYFSYLPVSWRHHPPVYPVEQPSRPLTAALIPDDPRAGYDVHTVIDTLVDAESFFEIKPLYARELVVGLALLEGRPVGVIANNPGVNGGVLFVDSADKAARFVWMCDAFNVPLLFLADVPGFMIGSAVEREGIIRHGAKMITAVSEATVPKVSVILRKPYGAGLYAMAGPAFEPDACIALPWAHIAVMGPEPVVNAVYANKIAAIDDPEQRKAFIAERQEEYEADVDLLRLASDLVIDAVVEPEDLRTEVAQRLRFAFDKSRFFSERHHGVPPV